MNIQKETLNNKLILSVLIFCIAGLTLFAWDSLGSQSTGPVSLSQSNPEKKLPSLSLSKEEIREKFKNDSIVQLGGLGQEIYFLDKGNFFDAAEKANRKAASIDDFREVLMGHLIEKSPLIQEVFQSDTAVLWNYIKQNNPDIIKTITASTSKRKKVHNLKEWNALMVYRIGDMVIDQKQSSKPSIDSKKNKSKQILSIPSTYKAKVGKNLLQLRLKDFKIDGDSLRFVYEIMGKHKHYNKNAAMHTGDGKIWMESLGNAKVSTRTDGSATILIEKGKHKFKSY